MAAIIQGESGKEKSVEDEKEIADKTLNGSTKMETEESATDSSEKKKERRRASRWVLAKFWKNFCV